jgi:hypothetical protein
MEEKMVYWDKRKVAALVQTVIAFGIYLGISIYAIVLAVQLNVAIDIETMTLFILQVLAFILLIVGMLLKKESLIIATLVAALAGSVASYFSTDVSTFKHLGDISGLGWALGGYVVTALVADIVLALGTVFLLWVLVRGDGKTADKRTKIVFYIYGALSLLGIGFASGVVATQNDNAYFLFTSLDNVAAAFSFIASILAFCYPKKSVRKTAEGR